MENAVSLASVTVFATLKILAVSLKNKQETFSSYDSILSDIDRQGTNHKREGLVIGIPWGGVKTSYISHHEILLFSVSVLCVELDR